MLTTSKNTSLRKGRYVYYCDFQTDMKYKIKVGKISEILDIKHFESYVEISGNYKKLVPISRCFKNRIDAEKYKDMKEKMMIKNDD